MAKKSGTGNIARGHLHAPFIRGKDSMASGMSGHAMRNPADHQKFQSLQEHANPPEHYEEGPCDMSQESYS